MEQTRSSVRVPAKFESETVAWVFRVIHDYHRLLPRHAGVGRHVLRTRALFDGVAIESV